MKLTKTTIAAVIASAIGAPTTAGADIINFTFTGAFTLTGGTGNVVGSEDAIVPNLFDGSSGFDGIGSRTPYSGSGTYDTDSGTGSADINPFSFFGGGLFDVTPISFKAIGDGMGGTGTLLAAVMSYDWNGTNDVPLTAIMDATGFFGSITAPGTAWSVQTGCTGCATTATPDTVFGHAMGAVPIAMTTFDTAGTTLDSLFPLTDDGKSGSPSTTAPISGAGFNFDFTTINATNVPQVPIPAAVWLFSSGLIGLASIARRRRSYYPC